MRHHFGWEDAAAVEATLSNGDWRQDFNGTQYYLDEDDGYETFNDYQRNRYKKRQSSKRERTTEEDDDFLATEGWNIYDRDWDQCKLKEERLQESWDGKMCQDDIALKQRFQKSSISVEPKHTTHVLSLSVYDHKTNTSTPASLPSEPKEEEQEEEQQQQQQEQQQHMLHWQKVETDTEQIDELMSFIRDLLLANRTKEQPNPTRQLGKRLEKLDRRNHGLLKRHLFESVLDSFQLLDLLSTQEMNELLDRYATADYTCIKYRTFVRKLLKKRKKKKRKRNKKQKNQENSNDRDAVGNREKSLIQGRWRDDMYKARIVIRCNPNTRRDKDDEESGSDDDEPATYTHVMYETERKRRFR